MGNARRIGFSLDAKEAPMKDTWHKKINGKGVAYSVEPVRDEGFLYYCEVAHGDSQRANSFQLSAKLSREQVEERFSDWVLKGHEAGPGTR